MDFVLLEKIPLGGLEKAKHTVLRNLDFSMEAMRESLKIFG